MDNQCMSHTKKLQASRQKTLRDFWLFSVATTLQFKLVYKKHKKTNKCSISNCGAFIANNMATNNTNKTIPAHLHHNLLNQIHAQLEPETVQRVLQAFTPENTPYLYGGCAVEDVTLLFLYYLLYNSSYHKLERLSTFPHSNFKQQFGSVRCVLCKWANEEI